MALTMCELKSIHAVLKDLGVQYTQPIDLHCDNQAAIYIAVNHVFHERTKYIEIDCHNVRDAVQDGFVRTQKVGTKYQLADILTKALGRREFKKILVKLSTCNPHAPT